jgi:hypothetical protein
MVCIYCQVFSSISHYVMGIPDVRHQRFNIILPSVPRSCKCPIVYGHPHQNSVYSCYSLCITNAPPISSFLIWSHQSAVSYTSHAAPTFDHTSLQSVIQVMHLLHLITPVCSQLYKSCSSYIWSHQSAVSYTSHAAPTFDHTGLQSVIQVMQLL